MDLSGMAATGGAQRNLLGQGDTGAFLAYNQQGAQNVADSIPAAQAFGTRLMELLRRQQQLGTRGFQEQGLNAQGAQVQRTAAQTSPDLIGANPGLQAGVRGAAVNALQPTVSGAQNSAQTFSEQIRSFGDVLSSAQQFTKDIQADEESRRSRANSLISFALESGGADGLQALMESQPDIFKIAGIDAKTVAGLLPAIKKKVGDKKEFTTVDLGDRVALVDNAGNVFKYLPKTTASGGGGANGTYQTSKIDVVINKVDEALKQVTGLSSGFLGGLSRSVGGTPAYDLKTTIQTIQANIGFNELQAMRAASPTGGALGQVAVQELEALQSVLGSLDTKQSPTQLASNLAKIKQHYNNWKATLNQGGSTLGSGVASGTQELRLKYGY